MWFNWIINILWRFCKLICVNDQDIEATGLINVTIYGKCSTRGEKTEDAFKNLDNYYFYLSFENSLCDDYITEKFFKMLKQNIVPVVMGAPRKVSYLYCKIFTNRGYATRGIKELLCWGMGGAGSKYHPLFNLSF